MKISELIGERLYQLANLDAGWLDGDGEVITNENIKCLLDGLSDTETKVEVFLYPTPTGGLLFEFSHDANITQLSIEIDFRNEEILICGYQTITESAVYEEFSFSTTGWRRMKELLETGR